jgi:hypothetical protein
VDVKLTLVTALFADVLRAPLADDLPDAVHELHHRASASTTVVVLEPRCAGRGVEPGVTGT